MRSIALVMAHELRLVGVAVQFLTRVPVRLRDFDPAWLNARARHFPFVGALVGLFAAVVLCGAAMVWPPPLAVLLSMAAALWWTGAFHEDGLADTCDGLGGAVTREKAIEIMKDSRLGSYGALGLMLTLAVKLVALDALLRGSPGLAAAALVLAHGVSRACAVVLLAVLPYAGDLAHAKAKPLAQRIGAMGSAVALAWVLALGLALGEVLPALLTPARLVLVSACAAAVCAACALWFWRRLGGYTGDTLGATQQWSELAVYLALVATAWS